MRRNIVEEAARAGERGLTLIEVVFASAILSVLLLGLFSSMAHAMRMDALSREREAATRAAMQELDDRVMAVSTDTAFDALVTPTPLDVSFHVALDTGNGQVNLTPAQTSPANASPSTQVGRLTVTELTEGTYDGVVHLIQARAVVRWRGSDGRDAEVILVSRKVRP